MNYRNIVNLAKTFKEKVETKHKFPKTITQDGKEYNYGTIAYYFAEFIKQGGKQVTDKKVNNSQNKIDTTIKESIKSSDYKDQAKRISQFIKQSGRCPSSVSTVNSKKTVRVRDWMYAFSKIVVFYSENTRFPNTCLYDSTVYKSSKKHSHSNKTGCDEMGQNTSYFCACHSFQEVMRKLTGVVVPQKTLASVMGTTTSGTGHDGIRTANAWFCRKYGHDIELTERYFSDFTQKELEQMIEADNIDIIFHLAYQNKYGHYEVVNSINSNQNNWNIQNSLGNKCSNGCYCGYKQQRSYQTQKQWINAKTGVKSLLIFKKK